MVPSSFLDNDQRCRTYYGPYENLLMWINCNSSMYNNFPFQVYLNTTHSPILKAVRKWCFIKMCSVTSFDFASYSAFSSSNFLSNSRSKYSRFMLGFGLCGCVADWVPILELCLCVVECHFRLSVLGKSLIVNFCKWIGFISRKIIFCASQSRKRHILIAYTLHLHTHTRSQSSTSVLWFYLRC